MNKIKNELKQLTIQELAVKADELRRELFSLRLQAATTQLDKTQFKKLRKNIARALTYMHQKAISDI